MKLEEGLESKTTDLLATTDEKAEDLSQSIYLTLTTKKHIVDVKRLKPGKIAIPHPLNTSPTTTILLITADPQRAYKDAVASPAFPKELGARITRVIGVTKLKAKFKQYEAQRNLRAAHDIILADERIITLLPKILGKTFYGTKAKSPIPVVLAPYTSSAGKKPKPENGTTKEKSIAVAADAKTIAAEIEKAIHATLVFLTPSTCTSVRVAQASWEPEKVAENVAVVAEALISRWVPKEWRGVKSIHIKGPNTTALPIWLADELWVDEADVLDEETARKAVEMNVGKKRKAILGGTEVGAIEEGGKSKKAKKEKLKLEESNDDKLDAEIAARKEKLKKQKAEAAKDIEDEVPKATKKVKVKKSKAVAV
jgi:ribosome biogenesis protein UTP30